MNSFYGSSFSIHLYFLFFLIISITLFPLPSLGCHDEERMALLDIKSNVVDPSGRLSSWQESIQHRNCCSWHGIKCSSESLHVISIDLRNKDFETYLYLYGSFSLTQPKPNTALRGKLSPYLFNITNLEYLDLGFNDFQGSEITHEFSYLTKLYHLDLSISNFSESISTQFSNLTLLQHLDLSCYWSTVIDLTENSYSTSCLKSRSTNWLRGLVNIQVLRLSGIDLSEATSSSKDNFAGHISSLWNLRDLDLSGCDISGSVFPFHQFHNLSRLSSLKMYDNYDLDSSIPLQLANLTSLSILRLSSCRLHGSIPYLPQLKELDVSRNIYLRPDLTRMFEHPWPKLQKLEISYTNATGPIPSSISNAPLLVSLSASQCSIQGSLPSSIYNLSRLQYLYLTENSITSSIHVSISNLKHLSFLDLSTNNVQGPIPDSICDVLSLGHIDLSGNNITGTIPSCITNLTNLSVFDVSRNSITGKVSLMSLINELDLTTLRLYANKLTVVIDQHIQPSKFIIEELSLGLCNMEGFIPTFICKFTQLKYLDMSDNNLTGKIPFCITKLKNLYYIDLSKNRLRGPLPLLPPSVNSEILIEAGESLCSVEFFILNDNELSGIILTSIGHCSSLVYLNLRNNSLTGNVPNELQKAASLRSIQLNDNNLEGPFPMFIQKLPYLTILNLGDNNFDGIIPTGIGSLSNLKFLSLRSNRFNGSIPKEITYLQQLQILDLSSNSFSGPIPIKLGNLSWLTSRFPDTWGGYNVQFKLTNKGATTKYEPGIVDSSGIDLSCNILTGKIPEEIGLLQGLAMLNLSYNRFSTNIPASIGNMSSLESLDLSSNRLSGHIPQSLTSIDTLGYLRLSHNNLSGRIPRGSHFDTLSVDGSAFAGNDLLCGYPLKKDCEGDENIDSGDTSPSSKVDEDDREDSKEKFLLYAIVAMGFAVGFWGLFFVLLLRKQKWWFPYWKTVDSVAVRIVECVHKKQQ